MTPAVMRRRIRLTLQYKGTSFNGWQTQANGVTIQETLEKTLTRILQQPISVHGSGRTDAGVHALAQVCHFDLDRPFDLGKIVYGLNALLPDEIAVIGAEEVPAEFHAQFAAKRKTYDYYLFNSAVRSPFFEEYAWRVPYPLNLAKMKLAAKCLVGEHDFKSFCAADSTAKTTIRRVFKIQIKKFSPESFPILPILDYPKTKRKMPTPAILRISITGGGFLKHMVRNIAGTLVEVGRGQMTLTEFKRILKHKDRRRAGVNAPAKGLFLRQVFY